MIIAPGLSALSVRQERSILLGLALGVIQLTSALIALIEVTSLIPDEIEKRTIYMILSKPVQRWQFFLGKYLGAILSLGMMMSLMTLVLILMFTFKQHSFSIAEIMALLKVPAMYFVQMSLLCAVGIFFSTFISQTVNFFLSGGLYMIGSLFNPILETFSENSQSSKFVQSAAILLGSILPNFANYNIQNPIINPAQQIQDESFYLLSSLAYGFFYICILLIGGVLIFDRREI